MKTLVLVLVLLLGWLQYRLWFGNGNLPEAWELGEQVEAQRAENARLRERNDALDAEVRDLQQGYEAIEEYAREDLGMVREGETFYQVIE